MTDLVPPIHCSRTRNAARRGLARDRQQAGHAQRNRQVSMGQVPDAAGRPGGVPPVHLMCGGTCAICPRGRRRSGAASRAAGLVVGDNRVVHLQVAQTIGTARPIDKALTA
jgi:hypothetical protein